MADGCDWTLEPNNFLFVLYQSIWGVLIMCSVSAAWVGATHILKSTFRAVHVIVIHSADNHSSTSGANHDDVRYFSKNIYQSESQSI